MTRKTGIPTRFMDSIILLKTKSSENLHDCGENPDGRRTARRRRHIADKVGPKKSLDLKIVLS